MSYSQAQADWWMPISVVAALIFLAVSFSCFLGNATKKYGERMFALLIFKNQQSKHLPVTHFVAAGDKNHSPQHHKKEQGIVVTIP